ncbi:MAG: glycosyltransferase [Marmoricola sp.]|nr:glycosyltransferase [Marmoricola sp.]
MSTLRIFAVTSYGSHTALTGGRLRRDNLLEALAQRGHDVERVDVPAKPGIRSALASGRLSLTADLRRRARAADVILVGDVFCLPMMPVLSRLGPPVVVELVDSPYGLVSSAPRGTAGEWLSAQAQRAQLLPVMQVLLPMADGVTYISEDDYAVDAGRVARLPPATVVPNGVHPRLLEIELTDPPADGYLAWLADWTYAPNRESFVWFASEVAPHLPDDVLGRVRTFGAGAPPQLHDGPGARTTRLAVHAGFVDPLSAVYEGARGIIAPVLRGAGIANKVLEPLAAGRPVVTTGAGARGLPQVVKQHVCIATTGEAFARAMTGLTEHLLRPEEAAAARASVASLSWSAGAEALEGALLAAVQRGTGPRSV